MNVLPFAYLVFVARPGDLILAWCRDHLGAEPAEVLFRRQSISAVFGLRLTNGTDVVVKIRPDDGRTESCVSAQTLLAAQGFPCARPLTPVTTVGSLAVHAEEFRPGGDILYGDSPDVAVRYADVFARLMAALESVAVPPPLPNPRWIRWDHKDPGIWPALDLLDVLLESYAGRVRYFDFGASTEDGGRTLNAGLVEYKEGFGARTVVHDMYEWELDAREAA